MAIERQTVQWPQKDRQYNGHRKKTINGLQNTAQTNHSRLNFND